jgi:hypothetical protein
MSGAPCPRLFEAEAMRDGRLGGAERGSFERHLTSCPACSREVQALEALAGALRAGVVHPAGADELHVRRERTRLLAAFDRALLGSKRSWRVGHRLLWPVLAVLVVVLLVLPRVRRPAPAPGDAPTAVIHAGNTAVWAERMVGDRENVILQQGALWIHVDHASGEGRLLVVLPDGELEDTGTTFTVSADDGHTTRVAVEEGHVVLRLRGQAAIALGPGDAWIPDPRPAASARTNVAPPEAAPATRAERSERSAPAPHAPASVTSPPASDPSAEFRAAMAALDVGDDSRAAAAFADFLEKHPGDARAEDAAYLRVVALQRSGDGAGTKRAALEYLRRYPTGFRQTEVEALSRSSAETRR